MQKAYIHPAFPQPDDSAVKIWRYMDDEKFTWLLAHKRIFMPTADKLGDHLEGSTPQGELDWWIKAAEEATSEDTRENIRRNREFLSQLAERLRNRYYVSCWHMNVSENNAMWGQYTSGPRSVAVQSNFDAIRNELPDIAYMGVVQYIDYETARLPTMNMFEHIMHKDTALDFEREMRVVVVPPSADELGLAQFNASHFELGNAFNYYAPSIDLKKIVQRVVMHPEAKDEWVEEVKALCLQNELPPPELSRRRRRAVF